MSNQPIVEFSHISMQFPGVLANDDVSLSIMPGEVFALVGENGAGKSTLMKILFGINTPSAGTITVKGNTYKALTSAQAIGMGIGMVHQHFMLVPSFSVAQNIVLGDEPKRGILYDLREAKRVTEKLVAEYGLEVPPDEPVKNLSVGLQQRVEILKTLHRGAEILILDEPTAVLTPQETDELFQVIREVVRDRGMTVIIITHKLGEVMAISNRVGVMRQGRLVGVYETAEVDERKLASLMVGKDVLLGPLERTKREPDPAEEPAIAVRGLTVRDSRGLEAVRNMSFDVRRGEIVGIAGVEGNGQSELVEAVTGMRPIRGGEVRVFGKRVNGLSPGKIRKLGLAHVPEDRLATGVAAQADITENLLIGKQRRWPYSILHIHMRGGPARRYARKLSGEFDIRSAGVGTEVGSLSGGNMQKVVVAREFSFDSGAMVIAQPTRGVDIGATDFFHHEIMKKRNAGCAILLVSADLDEIYRLSDRILTVYEGEITGEFDPEDAPREEVGRCMMGTARHPAPQPGPEKNQEHRETEVRTVEVERAGDLPAEPADQHCAGPGCGRPADAGDGARPDRGVPGDGERSPGDPVGVGHDPEELGAGEHPVPVLPADHHGSGHGRRIRRRTLQRRRTRPDVPRRAGRRVSGR